MDSRPLNSRLAPLDKGEPEEKPRHPCTLAFLAIRLVRNPGIMRETDSGPTVARDGITSMSAATQPNHPNPKLCIGPAGWDYPDWQGVVYPPGLKGTDRLTFLATLFTAVEINVTFYRPIPADYARRWLAAVADFPDFRFTAKVWQVFTHDRRLPEAELAQFQAGLAPLLTAGKLGVLLAQFPYSFHNTEENRAYLVQLKAALPNFPLAVEVRHRSWQQRAVREFLAAGGP